MATILFGIIIVLIVISKVSNGQIQHEQQQQNETLKYLDEQQDVTAIFE